MSSKTRQRPKSHSKMAPQRSALPSAENARSGLLKAAKHLFASRGLSGTSIRDIARAAKTNSSQISYYFGGKSGLYRACLEDIGSDRLSLAEKVLQKPQSKVEYHVRLRLFIENLLDGFLQDRDTGLILIREFDRLHSPAEAVFQTLFARLFHILNSFFSAAQKNKFISSKAIKIDPLQFSSLLIGVIVNELRIDHVKNSLFGRSVKDPSEKIKIVNHIVALFS